MLTTCRLLPCIIVSLCRASSAMRGAWTDNDGGRALHVVRLLARHVLPRSLHTT
jgi:hypothetical protein